jgi:hypothetical protein
MAYLNLSASKGFPKRIFSLTEAEYMKGSYSTYAIDPF